MTKSKPNKPTMRKRLRRILRIVATALILVYALVWWNVLRLVEHDHWPPPEDAITAAQAQAFTQEFVAREGLERDDAAIAFAPSTASDVQFFLDGAQFFPAIQRDLESAETSIHVLMFGFTPGGWGDVFADLLIQKVEQGVDVRLIVDGQGSKAVGDNKEFFLRLADAGIQIVVNDTLNLQSTGELPNRDRNLKINELGHADHRKMLVIDGRIGWVGGAGLVDHFYGGEWWDTFARVEGDIVLQLQAVFCTSFHAYSGELPNGLGRYFPKQEDPGDISVTILQNFPTGFVPGTQASRELIQESSQRLDVMNAYLTDAAIIDHIEDAAWRGVDVRLIVSRDSNVSPAQYALESQYARLLDAGVQILEVPGIVHAKVTVADDRVILGSINFDAWALYRNLELALLFDDASVADAASSQLVEPLAVRGKAAVPPDGWREEIPARFWWWLRYYL